MLAKVSFKYINQLCKELDKVTIVIVNVCLPLFGYVMFCTATARVVTFDLLIVLSRSNNKLLFMHVYKIIVPTHY